MKKLFTLIGAAALLLSYSFTNVPSKSVVVIDAGHGGQDNGSVVSGVKEKDITLSIAQKIKKLNKRKDITLVLIRDKDEDQSLEARAQKIKALKPKLVISLHANYANDDEDKQGLEIYISKQNKFHDASLAQANKMMELFKKGNSSSVSMLEKNLVVLNEALCPAMSIELGYLNSEVERKYLSSNVGQEEIAQKIVDFIAH
jgi:N-acetylmuramoyl-L-alanine amidase